MSNFQKYVKVEDGEVKLPTDVVLEGVTLKKGSVMKVVGLSHGGYVLLETKRGHRHWVHPSKLQ